MGGSYWKGSSGLCKILEEWKYERREIDICESDLTKTYVEKCSRFKGRTESDKIYAK